MKKTYFKMPLMVIALLSASAHAQQNEIYRYKDAAGNTIYADKLPKGKAKDVGVLSKKTGVLKNLSELEALANPVESNENQAQVALEKLQEAEQIKKDQYLLNTYSNAEEIEKIKLYELEQIDRSIQNDTNTLATLKDRKTIIEKDLKSKVGLKDRAAYESELTRLNDTHARTVSSLDKSKRMYLEREQKYNGEKERFKAVLEIINKEKESRLNK